MSIIDLFKTSIAAAKKDARPPNLKLIVDSKDTLRAALKVLVDAQNRIETVQAACDAELIALQTKYMAQVIDDAALVVDLETKIKAFVLTNKSIFPAGKKTADFAVAKVSYKDVPSSLVITNEEEACKELLECGLWWAVRTKQEVVKEAVKANWQHILDNYLDPMFISLSPQSETVTIKPATVAAKGVTK